MLAAAIDCPSVRESESPDNGRGIPLPTSGCVMEFLDDVLSTILGSMKSKTPEQVCDSLLERGLRSFSVLLFLKICLSHNDCNFTLVGICVVSKG